MSLEQIAKAVEASQIGTGMRESIYWFPALTFSHICGLLIAAGTVIFWDLRLLGFGLRHVRISRLAQALLPWVWTGFVIMMISGGLLVWMEAGRLYSNIFFRIKVVALILAGINVMVFHFTAFRNVAQWESQPVAPPRARLACALSLLLWFVILASGRAIGYTLNYGA
jgi:hypothetical protein